jgi:hypothetical protein
MVSIKRQEAPAFGSDSKAARYSKSGDGAPTAPEFSPIRYNRWTPLADLPEDWISREVDTQQTGD